MEPLLIVLGIAVLVGLGLLAFITRTAGQRRATLDKAFISKTWIDITQTAQAPGQAARFAVIEADKLLDYVLKQRGVGGETMGERLKAARNDFSNINDVWSAHKLRNQLVHEARYEVDRRLVARALKQFQQALKDLGAL